MSGAAHIRIARARGEADAAKARLMATVDEAKARLAPGTLASNAVQSAKDKSIVVADEAVAAVKERPGLTAGIAAAAALYIARKPLFSAVRGAWRGSSTDTHDNASGLTADELEKHNG
jgi:hypothetical protein